MLLVLFPLLINNFILPSHWLIIILFYLWVYVCQAWKMYGCYYLYPCIFWADLTSLSLVLRGRSHIMLYFSFYIVAILLWTQQVGQLCMPAHIKICRKSFFLLVCHYLETVVSRLCTLNIHCDRWNKKMYQHLAWEYFWQYPTVVICEVLSPSPKPLFPPEMMWHYAALSNKNWQFVNSFSPFFFLLQWLLQF